jgi:hypothetical protein
MHGRACCLVSFIALSLPSARKWKRSAAGAQSSFWEFEVGEEALSVLPSDSLRESAQSVWPKLLSTLTCSQYVPDRTLQQHFSFAYAIFHTHWTCTGIAWFLLFKTISVAVEGEQIVVRTTNKKLVLISALYTYAQIF